MINRNNQKHNFQQINGWRRLLAWLCSLTLLISSSGVTAFADNDDGIYSVPVTAPGNQVSVTPAPEEAPGISTPEETEPEASDHSDEDEITEPTNQTVPEQKEEIKPDATDGTVQETTEQSSPEGTEEAAPEGTEENTPENTEEAEQTEENENADTGAFEEIVPEPIPEPIYSSGTLNAETEGCSVQVDYPAEACIPEHAVLSVSDVAGMDLYVALKSAAKQIRNEENETWSRKVADEGNRFFSVSITDEAGNEVQPSAGVTLTCWNLSAPDGTVYFLTGENARILDTQDGTLRIEQYGMEPFGYATVEKVQIGTVTQTYEGSDYQVIASYGPEAGFPADTELQVREIRPGTTEYALYSGMTEEALDEEWSEITLERYFDITFVSGSNEVEPQADIDVQIIFKETIELTEEHDVQAVHFENNEATVIASETDSNEAAAHDDEAIDTVSFSSDSFSVYGVVQRKKITQKVLAADGQTYEIEVTYGPEAEIPEDAALRVVEIPEGSDLWEAYRKQTAAALGADDVRMPGLYDITIFDAVGNEVEPKAPVSVVIKLANAEDDEQLHVVHFTEEIPDELVKSEEQDADQPLAAEDQIASEKINATVEGQTVTFETDGFSIYAFAYKVDFEYTDENGEAYAWSFPGRGSYPLTDILAQVNHPEETVTGATLRLLEGEDHEGALYLTTDESTTPATYTLNSDIAFTDTYQLSIQTESKVYVLQVTDAVCFTVVVNYLDQDGNPTDQAALPGYYYIYVSQNKGNYAAVPGNAATTTLTFSQFTDDGTNNPVDYNPSADTYIDIRSRDMDASLAATNMGEIKDVNNNLRIKTDTARAGYSITIDKTDISNGTVTITLQQLPSYEVEIKFQNQNYEAVAPSSLTGNYYVYAAITDKKNDGQDGDYYKIIGPISLTESVQTIPFNEFRLNNQEPIAYAPGKDVTVYLVKSDSSSFANGDTGKLNGVSPMKTGDTINRFAVTSIFRDNENGKTTIIFREVSPYAYSLAGYAADGTTPANIDLANSGLSDNNWYLVTKLTKGNGGSEYYKIISLGNLNEHGATATTGTIDYFFDNGVESSSNKAVYVNADTAVTRLVHMTTAVDPNNYGAIVTVFNDTDNNAGKNEKTAGKYFTGGDGLYRYTVRAVDSSGQASVTLIRSADPVVTVNTYGTDGSTAQADLLTDSGSDNYYLYARLSDDPEYGYLEKLDKAASAKDYTISAFTKNNEDRQKYLTGSHRFDAWIIRKSSNGDISLEEAYRSMTESWTNDPIIYSDGSTVGCAKLDLSMASGNTSDRNASINLTKIDSLTLNSKIYNTKAATSPSADSGLTRKYYVLLTMQEGRENVYHLQELDVNTEANKDYTIQYLTKVDGSGKYYYTPGKALTLQMVASNEELTISDVIYSGKGSRFDNGSVTGELYKVTLNQDGYTLTSELRKLDNTVQTDHSVNTYFYGADKETTETISPALGTTEGEDKDHRYYIVATLRAKDGDRVINKVAAYQIAAFEMTDTDGSVQTSLSGEYQLVDAGGNNVDSTKIGYDPDMFEVSVRLYHKDQLPGDYLNAAVYNSPSDIVPGYDFMSNEKVTGQEVTEIKLHKSYTKDYKVRVSFDPSSPAITAGDKLYLLVTLEHRMTGTEYGFISLGEIEAGTLSVDYTDFDWYKLQDSNYISTSASITGNEKTTVRLLLASGDDFDVAKAINRTNCTVFGEGEIAKGCIVSYAQEQTKEDENNTTTHITDYVKLTKIRVSSDYSFTDILGQGVYYGINANVLNQQNHIQSNFAVNNYTGNGQPIEADLASEAGAFIATDVKDSMFIGNSHSGDVLLYVNPDDAIVGVAPRDPRGFVYTIATPAEELETQVNAILNHGASMSAALATHPATFVTNDLGKNYIDIDTYDFLDDATIYLDGDALRGYISTTSGIKLTKKPNQMIVFNFSDSSSLRLGKFEYRYGREDNYMVTDSPIGHGDVQNDNIDLIAKHVVWNVQNATSVIIDICTGMFLIPQINSQTTVAGTSSGWIITGGKVTNEGEWHSVYGELPSVSKTNLNVGKTIDGKTPNGSQVFSFTVEHLNNGSWDRVSFTDENGNPTDTVQNTNGTIKADGINVLNAGWNIYRIKESMIIPESTQTTGEYVVDSRAIYAVVQYVKKLAAGGTAAWIATTPVYFVEDENGTVSFSETAWTPNANDLDTAFGPAAGNGVVKLSKQTRPAFLNTTKRDRLSISKVVTGTTDTTKAFSFILQVQVPDPSNNSYTPWQGIGAEVKDEEPFTIQITGMDEPIEIAIPGSAGYDSAAYRLTSDGSVSFTLCAGQTAGFNGLPIKHRYTVTENNLDVNNHSTTDPGYALLEGTSAVRQGTVNDQSTISSETFTNVYTATGSVTLTGTKQLVNVNDHTKSRPLSSHQFGFELKQGSELLQTKYNDADGQIAFDIINYTQDDMIDAADNGEGGRTKTIVYTVREIDGDAGIDNTGITKDEDKTITVTLTDDGRGNITASQTGDDLKASFINTYTSSTTATIEGTKILTGRNMTEEEFTFTATLTKIDGEDVTESTDTSGTDKTLMTVTNAAAAATEEEGVLTATDHFSFETITFTKPGTYVYTVTEDEPLPTHVAKRPGSESYTATITVTEGNNELIATVTYDPEDKTIINDYATTGFTVRKEWVGNAPKDASIDVVIKRYKLVEETPEYGKLTIDDSFTGLDSGDTYTVSYTVDGEAVSSGTDVVVGTHTIEKTVTDYNDDKYTATNTSETRTVSVTSGGTTASFSGTVFTKRTGSLTINDPTPTGLEAGSYTVTYKIGEITVQTGTTLEVGTYTVTKTVSGYDTDAYNATNTSETAVVIVTKDGGIAGFNQTVFSKKSAEESTCIITILSTNDNLSRKYTVNKGVTYTFTFYQQYWQPSVGSHFYVGSTDYGQISWNPDGTSFSVEVNGDTTITITETRYDNFGNVTNFMRISPEPSSVTEIISNTGSIKWNVEYYRTIASNAVSDVKPNAVTAQANTSTTTLEATNNNTNPSYDGYNLIADEEWSKTVRLSSGNWSSSLNNLPVEDGEGNQYVYYIESVTETGVPTGTSVTFTQDGGYKQVVTGREGNRILSITDTVPTTAMSVIKSWDDNDDAAGIRPESITVHLKADGTVVKDAVLNADNNWSVTWNDLPIYNESGNLMTYTISEDEITDYRLMSKTYDSGTCTFTLVNTPSSGDLEVEKIVETGDQSKDFSITVTLGDSTINGTYGDMDFTNGVANITLKHGGKATAEGLPANITYTVAESAPAGYSASYSNATGTITAGNKETATVTNNYSASGTVPFKARKIFNGGTLAGGEFTFALTEYTDDTFTTVKSEGGVTQTEANNADGDVFFENVTLSSTATRYFTIAETEKTDESIRYDEHIQKITVTVADNGAGTLTPTKSYDPVRTEELSAGDYDASFTNTKLVNVKVRKVFGGVDALSEDFRVTNNYNDQVFTVDGKNGTVAATGNGTEESPYEWTIINVPVDTEITFTESNILINGYSLTVNAVATTENSYGLSLQATSGNAGREEAEESDGSEAATEVNVAEFINIYSKNPGSLSLKKTVIGGEEDREFTFTLTLTNITGLEESCPYTRTDTEGEHTLTLAFAEGDETKTVGTATITLKHNETILIQNIPAGTTYQITEADYSEEGYVQSLAENSDPLSGTIEGGTSAAVAVECVNTRELVDIDVSKIWKNSDGTDITETILNASVVFTLEKSTDGENWTAVNPEQTLSVTDAAMNAAAWVAHWTNLLKYENNIEVRYRVTESAATVNGEAALMPEDKTHVFTTDEFVTAEGTDNAKASVSFTNTLPVTSVRVDKRWLEDDEAIIWPDEIASISVGLYQNGNPANETVDGTTKQKIITFTKDSTEEERTFGNLPKYDASGKLISYSVQEKSVKTAAGADADVTDDRVIIDGINTWIVDNGAVNDGVANITNTKVKTSFNILKVNGNDESQKLTGAEFTLKKLGGEEPDKDGYSTVFGYKLIAVDENGHASITGLTDGSYRLYETKSPAGYTAYFGAVEFTITNGTIRYTNTQYVTYAKTENQPGTFTVRNYPGAVLPATGGSGTLIYTLSGLALMILAVMLLVGRKRKANR